jgi:hypothetical protein
MRIKVRLTKLIEWLLTLGKRDVFYQPVNPDADSRTGPNAEQANGGKSIPAYIVAGASMSRIDAMEDKQYWERKFTKDDIIALKKITGVTLTPEYEMKLMSLDVVRPGDVILIPTATESVNGVEDVKGKDDVLLLRLSLFFKDENTSVRFVNSIKDMDDKEIITLLKKYRDAGLCSDTSKSLWRELNKAGFYKTGYTNWNAQLNKP